MQLPNNLKIVLLAGLVIGILALVYKYFSQASTICPSTVTDIDGNTYKTVKIGTQCWMRENLKVTKNPENKPITRYCYNNDTSICDTDGGLYDWNTAMDNSTTEGAQGICPSGWHIPKDSEWYVLENYLKDPGQTCFSTRDGKGDCGTAGAKLKKGGSSGFEANLVGVYAALNRGGFVNRDTRVYFWSSTEYKSYPWIRVLDSSESVVGRLTFSKVNGFSVRCLKN